jgi:parallel beta-helix repeat protein
MRSARTILIAVAAALITASSLATPGAVAGSASRETSSALRTCAKAAAVSGRDTSSGSVAHPFRTVQRLVDALRPGQVGCLFPGTYSGGVSIHRGGRPGKPIVLTSATRRALVRGAFWVADDANDVVVTRLRLDGSTTGGQPSPQINGDRVVFRDNDVSNGHTGICFAVGGAFGEYGFANQTVIASNRIHDCGRLPRTNHDHGIYLEGSRGARVVGNLIYRNADWGVHLYPEADRTYVAHNVIDGNGGGIIVAGDGESGEDERPHSSDHNLIELNVITNSNALRNIEAWWGGPVGVGNVARQNCVWNGRAGNIGDRSGLAVTRTVVADPRFVNRGAGNFRMLASSRCRRLGAGPRH